MNTFFEKFKMSSKRGLKASRKINPHEHWVLLLRIFIGLSVLLILWSFYLLYEIQHEQIFQTSDADSSATGPALINDTLLTKITTMLSDRNDKEKELMTHPVSYPDPSLE